MAQAGTGGAGWTTPRELHPGTGCLLRHELLGHEGLAGMPGARPEFAITSRHGWVFSFSASVGGGRGDHEGTTSCAKQLETERQNRPPIPPATTSRGMSVD
ncbi:hypothetical protein GCM10023238_03190 [Streptomyces heliomycini]